MFQYFFQVLRFRGPLFICIYLIESLFFDWRFRVDTSIRVPKEFQLSSISSTHISNRKDGLLYVASFSSVLMRTIRESIDFLDDHNLSRTFQFVDLGCGKGKSLYFFANYFSAYVNCPVLGIEYDQSLASIASKNLSTSAKINALSNVICDSATNFLDYISSQTLIIYLYNSFQGDTLQDVISKMRHLNIVIIYVDPAESLRFEDMPDFQIISSHAGRYNADTWKIYTNILDT